MTTQRTPVTRHRDASLIQMATEFADQTPKDENATPAEGGEATESLAADTDADATASGTSAASEGDGTETLANDEDAFVIPEDLSGLDDEALASLTEEAIGHFDSLYGDGSALSDEDVTTLSALTEGIETLNGETAAREEAAAERAEAAAALAARIRPEAISDNAENLADALTPLITEDEDVETAPAEEVVEVPEDQKEKVVEAVTASSSNKPAAKPARKNRVSVPLSSVRKTHTTQTVARSASAGNAFSTTEVAQPKMVSDVILASDAPGYQNGKGMDWADLGRAVDRRLSTFNQALYQNAAARGQHMREQLGIAMIRKPFEQSQIITSNDPEHVESVFERAIDQTRLPGGSLVASGGWCAPSEVIYDLFELESRDGLLSVPEVGVARGGIQFTQGPSFADIYSETGFCFTEQDDIDGNYAPGENEGDPNVEGPKPCYHIECPEFEDARLDVCGICLTAGLLQSRGYPEVIARVTRGAMIAHDHRMSANLIQQMVAGSTAVTFPGEQAGATAPVLSAIELQAEHYKYSHRMTRNSTLEAVFPFWVRGVIRSDLSRRLGVDLIDVTDARIDGWFRARNIAAQFVYDWQAVDTTDASAFTAWPTELQFLLYAAGTWVRGSADVITLDTIYDSVMLGTNDYTALFTEEGWLMAKRGPDSRVVTVPICPDGATHGGIDIACDGTVAAAA